MPWVRQPDAGGVKVAEAVKRRTKERILQHAEKYASNFTRLDIRFRRQFCYVDAYSEPLVPRGWPPTGPRQT